MMCVFFYLRIRTTECSMHTCRSQYLFIGFGVNKEMSVHDNYKSVMLRISYLCDSVNAGNYYGIKKRKD